MKFKLIQFIISFMFLYSQVYYNPLNAQNRSIDSLQTILKTTKEDTNKVDLLIQLSKYYFYQNDIDKAILNVTSAKLLAEKMRDKKRLAISYITSGELSMIGGKYSEALKLYQKALSISKEINAEENIALAYFKISDCQCLQGKYDDALNNILMALKIYKELGIEAKAAEMYDEIGRIYRSQGNDKESLKYYLMALKIKKQIGNKKQIAKTSSHLAVWYFEHNDLKTGLFYNTISLKIHEALGDKFHVSELLLNEAQVLQMEGNYSKSLQVYDTALKYFEKLNFKSGIANIYGETGNIYLSLKKMDAAKKYLNKSLTIFKEISNREGIIYSYKSLIALDTLEKNYKKALNDYKLYIAYKDSSDFEEINQNVIKKRQQIELDQQEAKIKADADYKESIRQQKLKQQTIIRYSSTVACLVILLFLGFLFRNFKQKQRNNLLLVYQNKDIESKNDLLNTQSKAITIQQEEIVYQKHTIEEKQKEITDSIHVAQRIQNSLLTSQHYIKKCVPDFFILYQPKDIVSGDFYWATKSVSSSGVENFILITADCTGHGVPGALMSMLGINFLNEFVAKDGYTQPDIILNHLRSHIISVLNPESNKEETKDGMDAVVCTFDFNNRTLKYSAANNSFYIIRNNELIECKADKMPVGKSHADETPFTLYTIQLQKGDMVYTFTDGYADQFGGPKGKKLKYKQLEQILLDSVHLPMQEQKEVFEKYFEDWKNTQEQVDDVLLIGVKIS